MIMPTKNLYITKEQKRRMDEAPHINWSVVFAQAVDKALAQSADSLPKVMEAWAIHNKTRRSHDVQR